MKHDAPLSFCGVVGIAGLVALAACSGGAQDGPGATSAAAPTTTVDPAPVASATPSASASAPAPQGPQLAASDAPAAEREAAALKILRGEADAKQAAVLATDDGAPLDPTLRNKISPRVGPPTLRMGAITVTGKLPPEVIQRIVRQHFGTVRRCYEEALKKEPTLEGKVEVKFTIDATGAVSKVGEGPSTIQDAEMRTCVTKVFRGLSFPQPESGIVTVVFPIVFGPTG